MDKFKLDRSYILDKLKNRIIYGSTLELTIVKNFSTNKLKQAELYNKIIEEALEYLVGKDGRKHPIQLFELIKESDFNTRYMEIISWLEHLSNKYAGILYQEVFVENITEDKIIFRIIN